MPIPAQPKIYHIVHEDRLPSILGDGWLWCDATMVARAGNSGTTIGMSNIKQRRLTELTLDSHPSLHVGDCVPFYFCPRSIMLYLLYQSNHHELSYRGGQGPIVHLEADLAATVSWAESNGLRWAFTLSNAGAYYFEDRADLAQLDQVDWTAVQATDWRAHKEGKQAEFLVERQFPWELVTRVGVQSIATRTKVLASLQHSAHRPPVEHIPGWYY
ncbi:MAG: DUF4433 domain-containing protein [Polyangiaceae bacterium]